jgi:hypothetical protein
MANETLYSYVFSNPIPGLSAVTSFSHTKFPTINKE